MTATGTRTSEYTITDARYVGAKMGADLRLLNTLYGQPGLALIDKFVEEAALLLRDGYLRTVDYGFRDEAANCWKLRLRYTATAGGYLLNSPPGSLPASAAVAGYSFCSHLTYSQAYEVLSTGQQAAVQNRLPLDRVTRAEPATGPGAFTGGHGYARNGIGVSRDVYIAS